jgi:membrane-associated phospholipid phosphatase
MQTRPAFRFFSRPFRTGLRGRNALSANSAFPSMHVTMVTLLALAAWPIGGALRWLYIAYAAAILVGSVRLGWHYAVDGYVAATSTIALWFSAGHILRFRTEATPGRSLAPESAKRLAERL